MVTPATLSDQPGTFLYCPSCGDRFSATRGDYWMMGDDEVFACSDCDDEMIEARAVTTIVNVDDEREAFAAD